MRYQQNRKTKATTNSQHDVPVAANLREPRSEPSAANQPWLVNIVYVPTEGGWLYLTGFKNVFICKIGGYDMGERTHKSWPRGCYGTRYATSGRQ